MAIRIPIYHTKYPQKKHTALDIIGTIIYVIGAVAFFFCIAMRIHIQNIWVYLLVSGAIFAIGICIKILVWKLSEKDREKEYKTIFATETPQTNTEERILSKERNEGNRSPMRYCKFCGAVIDPDTKKCMGCGHQYANGKSIAIILLSVACVGLLVSTIFLGVCYYKSLSFIGYVNTEIEKICYGKVNPETGDEITDILAYFDALGAQERINASLELEPQTSVPVEMTYVDAFYIDEVGYDKNTRTFYVHFSETGSLYKYYDVPPRAYKELISSQNPGSYFQEEIRNKYESEKIE